VGFLTGFVAVLCIGNYYRAKRAMERQKQKRLARLSGHAGNGVIGVDSPGSNQSTVSSSHPSEEQHNLLGGWGGQNATMKQQTARRRNMEDNTDSLLLDVTDTGARARIAAV
jgi:hypothetical protein